MMWVEAWTKNIPVDAAQKAKNPAHAYSCNDARLRELLGIAETDRIEGIHRALYEQLIPAYQKWINMAMTFDVETSPAYDVVG
ncbi:hypothetical protein CYMTET_38578 [Cymbomonas tetramitiformis]|uniref:Uncharacterized protein n=1 Tax=Cymbomonas tetramitiformis TaxID=36881 RepID=A0AAE0F5J1_9CHLO|nr:hypothetical protein CYMTET_38578 [Cymbomonas tetramitiformis]